MPETRVSVRISSDLKRQVMAKLALQGKSLTDLVIELLTAWLQSHDKK